MRRFRLRWPRLGRRRAGLCPSTSLALAGRLRLVEPPIGDAEEVDGGVALRREMGLAGAENQGLLPPENTAQSLYGPIYSVQPAPGYVAALALQAKAAALVLTSVSVIYWQWIPTRERIEGDSHK